MICAGFFFFFSLWDRPVFVTLAFLQGVSGIRSRLQHQVLVAGQFWQGVQEKKKCSLRLKWDAFRGASECCCVSYDTSKDFLFPTLSLVVVTPLYVSHSFSSLVADRLTKD
jgi:hypothetical protein